jgi:geranylgeranyl diphosphate synthase, type II
MMNSYEKLLPLIEKRIEEYCSSLPDTQLNEPVRYVMQLGGKRIRPALCLMASEIFDGHATDTLSAAIALEVFHNFTLVHDDIMDQAPLRRGKPAVHMKWSSNSAILSGDVMSVHATQLILSERKPWVDSALDVFLRTAVEVCEGQQLDMDFEKIPDVPLAQYLEMIRLKTAVLVACALKMGAIAAHAAEDQQRAIYDFGQYMGLAFQIKDDYLDVFGDEEQVGKQKAGDIVANKKTFLSVKARELADKDTNQQWDHLLKSTEQNPYDRVAPVMDMYLRLGVDKFALNAVEEYTAKAFHALNQLTIEDQKKKYLLDFMYSLASRVK